ncbi:MAG: hypothetical protein M1816_008222 [Peltula sp. TS41687]|nr:MAG: hypothetical protein M1816_008222 [Peltula sp. TS41687]
MALCKSARDLARTRGRSLPLTSMIATGLSATGLSTTTTEKQPSARLLFRPRLQDWLRTRRADPIEAWLRARRQPSRAALSKLKDLSAEEKTRFEDCRDVLASRDGAEVVLEDVGNRLGFALNDIQHGVCLRYAKDPDATQESILRDLQRATDEAKAKDAPTPQKETGPEDQNHSIGGASAKQAVRKVGGSVRQAFERKLNSVGHTLNELSGISGAPMLLPPAANRIPQLVVAP